jgi:hypothetical protein
MAWVLILQGMDKIKKDLTNPLYSLPPPDFSFTCGGRKGGGRLPFIQQRGIILTFEYISLFSV